MTLELSPPRGDGTTPARVGLWEGIGIVARLDLIQRWRTARTRWVLLSWVVAVYGFVALTWFAAQSLTARGQAALFYGVTMFVVVSLVLLVTPSLAASAISGDRADGVLAPLQVTLLSPAQIALGKFLAAWGAALGFLVIASPVLLWALAAGGVTPGSFALGLLTLVLVAGTMCALGLAISALTARVVSSTALTYVLVGFLAVGTPLLFGLTLPLTRAEGPVRVLHTDMSTWKPGPGDSDPPPCTETTEIREQAHSERTWWLLALNPYAIVADAAPGAQDLRDAADPLRAIQGGVRMARAGARATVNECWSRGPTSTLDDAAERAALGLDTPAWPLGFATYALLTAGALAVTVRRLRTPVRRLPRGTRIA